MLSWILLVLISLWLLRQRVGKEKIFPDLPLGMPEGTVRALLAIVVVSFPFTFFWRGVSVPSIVANLVFVVIAFYFEKRSQKSTVKEAAMEISEERKKVTRDQLPLYLPKYTVRTILVALVVALFVNSYLVASPLPTAINTFIDILAMVGSFVFGMLGRSIEVSMAKRKIRKRKEKTGETLQQAAQALEKEDKLRNARLGSFVSYVVCSALILSLFFFTFDIRLDIFLVEGVSIPIREALFMSVNVYFGFRQ
ncbi:MAG: hypothetical protein JW839_16580 [Candidatus Lokiarchaeota archaeon]|nr:hypothetical protein [Candidatus Lokiarchaeota archaeon]